MAKKRNLTKHDLERTAFLRLGGRKIAASLAAKGKASMKSTPLENLETRTNLRMQGAKLYRHLKGGSPIAVDDPANRKTLDAILRLHKKVASKKLPFPKVTVPSGGFVPVTLSGTAVPPFDFVGTLAQTLDGNPVLSDSANKNGQISAGVVTPETGGVYGNYGVSQAEVGIHFTPPVPGILKISANPTYSFQELTNSLNNASVAAVGIVYVHLRGQNNLGEIEDSVGDYVHIFDETTSGQLQFNFKFGVQQAVSVSAFVTPSLLYWCSVGVLVDALGMGWPGSLAVSIMSATVPSISYEFTEVLRDL
jgi:hypothetical protein